MDAFFTSTLLVALGEIGDKTQLLSLALVVRYRKPWPILAGVIVATLINHGISVWFGDWLAGAIPENWLQWILGLSFIALGLWMLIPDKDEEVGDKYRFGPFLTSLVLFFIAEIGDKTQVATVALAVRFQEFWPVLLGTTTGMIAANLPVIWVAHRFASERFETWAHRISAALFIVFGVWALL
ncbi:TMEM165/GDT1 family protein [Alloalcanivorax sp. C16-2]|uniref:TMEM165/GDT1 family protein n=1 Tax=Alloalcanivorax TaxID=3020832 RepID=UPI0019324EE1|nr:TMEM165/GDT1 family protein [Alloalcanivorax marinus]MBL7251018.1 TMEM165/GDT1 family protein [Alloalcanivorax marinus]